MTVRPVRPSGSSNSGSGTDNSAEIMDAMPVNQVFVKNSLGKLVGIGIRQLADGTVLAPDNFGVESGSVNFGDLITLSEAAGYLGMWNHLDNKQYQFLDYYVPRDKASSKPYYFRLTEGEYRFDGLSADNKTITTNPLTFSYTTQLNARTNSLILTAASEMKNVRLRISKGDITLKYLPTKAAYLGQETGYDFQAGENILDFGDSPVPLSEGVTLEYEIIADNMALRGSSDNVPKMSAYLQRGEYVSVLSSHEVSKVATSGDYNDLINKPEPGEIDYPVSSVNGKTGEVELTASDVGAADIGHTHQISDVKYLAEVLNTKLTRDQTIPYSQISGTPTIPAAQIQSDWGSTDQTSPAFIKNKPYIFDGDYTHLSNRPDLFSGRYGDLTGRPVLATVAETGSYVDLADKPVLFDGNYNSLTNKPEIPVVDYPVDSVNGKYGDVVLTNLDLDAAPTNHTHTIPDITGLNEALNARISRSEPIPYSSLINTPTIPAAQVNSDWNATTGVAQILNKPTLFSGKYTDLTGKPTIPAAQIQSDWAQTSTTALDFIKNKPILFSGSYADLTNKPVFATVATSGSYADLTNKPVIPAAQVQSDWNATTGLGVILNKPTIPTNTNQLTNGSGFITATNAPVTSVNTKTGAVVLAATDVGAAPTAQGTKYYRQAGTQATGMKVKYYTVTADSNGGWTLSLGSDFTEILDVQATALSTASTLTGIRQATVNTYTATSTTITGAVFTNSVLVTLVVSGTNSLTMAPSATVKIRVEGIGA